MPFAAVCHNQTSSFVIQCSINIVLSRASWISGSCQSTIPWGTVLKHLPVQADISGMLEALEYWLLLHHL